MSQTETELPVVEDAIVRVRGLRKSFGQQMVLFNVELDVPRGKITAIIGKSGEGKSVLLKCLVGLLEPDHGTIDIDGEARRPGPHPKIGLMFQHNALFESMTAFDNVALPLRERTRKSPEKIAARVRKLLKQLDLEEFEDKYPAQLSGGMQKRVALARALALDPEIILFDEPTTGLDPQRRNDVFLMIRRYQRKFGFTAILVSHDLPEVLFFTDHVVALEDGEIGFAGTPLQLEQRPSQLSQAFLNSRDHLREMLCGLLPRRGLWFSFHKIRTRWRYILEFRLEPYDVIERELGDIAAHLIENLVLRHFADLLVFDDDVYSIGPGHSVLGTLDDRSEEAIYKLLEERKEGFLAALGGLRMSKQMQFAVDWAIVRLDKDSHLEPVLYELDKKRRQLCCYRCD